MALSANTRQVGNVAIIDLSGKITLGENTGILRNAITSAVSQGHKNLLLNLADVTYVDSAGLGELVGAYTTATNQGGAVKLLGMQSKLKDLMTVTKLHTIFPSFENEAEAVASFGSAATA
jgi:anti-sigma B factor antagonist